MVDPTHKEFSSFEQESKTKKHQNVILGMTVKRNTTLANTLAIPLIFCTTTAAGAYYNMQ